jgi:hypothetical protein
VCSFVYSIFLTVCYIRKRYSHFEENVTLEKVKPVSLGRDDML